MNGALDNLKSTAETAFIDIGTKLLPMVTNELKSLSNEVSNVADWFNGLSSGEQDFVLKTIAVTAATGPAVLIMGKFATSLSSIISVAGAA